MASYNVQGDVLLQGTNNWIRVDMEDENGSNPVKIGFVQNWNIRKDLQTNEARVIGELVPVSIDVTGISVAVNFTGFIPTKEVASKGINVRGGGGKVHGVFRRKDVCGHELCFERVGGEFCGGDGVFIGLEAHV